MNKLTDLILSLPKEDRYGILVGLMEEAIENETDQGYLALIAAHLFELSEKALKKSGVEVISEGSDAVN